MSSLPALLTMVDGVSDDGARVLSLRGALDASNADVLLAAVIRCDPEAGDALVVDVDGVTFVDSSGRHDPVAAGPIDPGRRVIH